MTLQDVWDRQSQWSQAADGRKATVQTARSVALGLTLLGTLLATAAVMAGVDTTLGKVLAAVSGFLVAIAGSVKPFFAKDAIENWTRTRAVAEGIKSEVYLCLTQRGEYRG